MPAVMNALLSYNVAIPAQGREGRVNEKSAGGTMSVGTVGNPCFHCVVI